MSRGFTKEEREKIEKLLIEKGRDLFQQYGFQKTSITQITQEVGIAQGSFYTFFSSKEELYFLILENEEERIREKLLNLSFATKETPQIILKQLFKKLLHLVANNRLIKELYIDDQFTRLRYRLSDRTLEQHFINDAKVFKTIIAKWESLGITINVSPELLAGVSRSLFIIAMQKETIGTEIYDETIDFLLMGIVNELVNKEV